MARRLCALPIEPVIESLRPLAIEAVAGAPDFVAGVSVIRGEATPVVDVAVRLGDRDPAPAELWLRIRSAPGPIALAVTRVIGVRSLTLESLRALPPILGEESEQRLDAIGALDAQLLLLRSARVVPDAVWAQIGAAVAP